MRDGRSSRKAKVIRFVDRLEIDRVANFNALVAKAKMLRPDGFNDVTWEMSEWKVTAGRLVKLTGKNTKSSTFFFCYPELLGGQSFDDEWSDFAKALFLIRFHRKNQSASSQRFFLTAIGYLAHSASKLSCDLSRITPEVLNAACINISKDYAESTAYNLHKIIGEIAAHCDANCLCRIAFQYKYSGMSRPQDTGGVDHMRLDDPRVLETKNDKLIEPKVFKVIGELYQKVPKDHKYRFYILLLTLLFCLGRRFSEITTLPLQDFKKDLRGKEYLEYFPKKKSQGDSFTPRRKLFMPTEALAIVKDVIQELEELCRPARETAKEMHRINGPDLRFLHDMDETKKLYTHNLEDLGVPSSVLDPTGWIRKNNLAFIAEQGEQRNGKLSPKPMIYTDKNGVIAYCRKDYVESLNRPIHIDQDLKTYYLKDMFLVRFLGSSSGAYTKWLATQCTHSMMTTFLRYFPGLAMAYASCSIEVDFNSHHFRHTLNTLLDEGGLSDLLQTEWFGRTNPKDTKAYQHTSREKKALIIREKLLSGQMRGSFANVVMAAPVSQREALVNARVRGVHDVGLGMCIHPFSQLPCQRHLQCAASCDELLTENDESRQNEQKRQLAVTIIARDTAEALSTTDKPKKSMDWLAHNDKKIEMLNAELKASGVTDFDPRAYFKDLIDQTEVLNSGESDCTSSEKPIYEK